MTKSASQPCTEMHLSFLKVAQLLAGTPIGDGSALAAEQFLSLLRTGELRATMLAYSDLVESLEIPAKFWTKMKSRHFEEEISESESNEESVGMYLLSKKDAFEFYVTKLYEEKLIIAARDDILRVSRQLSAQREVVILRSGWLDFLSRHGFNEPQPSRSAMPQRTENRGTKERTSWKILIPFIARELQRPGWQEREAKELAGNVYAAAQNAKVMLDISEGTLKQEIGKIRKAFSELT